MSADEYIAEMIHTLTVLRTVIREAHRDIIALDKSLEDRLEKLVNIDQPKDFKTRIRELLEKRNYPEDEIERLMKAPHLFYYLEEKGGGSG